MTTMFSPQDHVIQLPSTPRISTDNLNPSDIAKKWLSSLENCLTKGHPHLSEVFHEDSWWRDMLGLDWEFHTIKGLGRIEDFASQHQARAQLSNFRLQDGDAVQPAFDSPVEGLTWLTSVFSFETRSGRGSGVFYLTQAEEGSTWKAYSIYTSLQELKAIEEPLGSNRLEGTVDSMPGGISKGTWIERRQRQVEFVNEEPTVLVIGTGKRYLGQKRTISLGILIKLSRSIRSQSWRSASVSQHLLLDC